MALDSEALVETVTNVQASRYLSAAGVMILFYDHLLTFNEEVTLIWNSKTVTPKILFLALRYVVGSCVLIHTYQSSGLSYGIDLPDMFCKVWLNVALCLGMITIALGNLTVLLHVWGIWERKSRFVKQTMILYVVTHTASIVGLVTSVREIIPATTFSRELRLCGVAKRDISFTMLWVPGLVFEVMMLGAVLWNALDRPRTEKDELGDMLRRDGVMYFATLTVLRTANLTLSVVAPLSLIFLGVFFIWCTTTITVTRFMLNMRRIQIQKEVADVHEMQKIPDHLPTLRLNSPGPSLELQTFSPGHRKMTSSMTFKS